MRILNLKMSKKTARLSMNKAAFFLFTFLLAHGTYICHAKQETAQDKPDPKVEARLAISKIAKHLRANFDKEQQCPTDLKDNQSLIMGANGISAMGLLDADVRSLIAKPKDPASIELEPGLPTVCAYDTEGGEWHKTQLYCSDQNSCYIQPSPALPKNCTAYTRSPRDRTSWIAEGPNCKGFYSCRKSRRNPGCSLDLTFAPLGEGIFILIFELDGQWGTGLLFAPTKKDANTKKP